MELVFVLPISTLFLRSLCSRPVPSIYPSVWICLQQLGPGGRSSSLLGSSRGARKLFNPQAGFGFGQSFKMNCIIYPSFLRNMMQDDESIVGCLRNRSVSQLTSFDFGTPSFLTSMGPSKDGVLIPNDFDPFGNGGPDVPLGKRASGHQETDYQVSK